MDQLIKEIKGCTVCAPHLINGVNPVMAAHKDSKIAIIGQATCLYPTLRRATTFG